jgi:hypothetical protein
VQGCEHARRVFQHVWEAAQRGAADQDANASVNPTVSHIYIETTTGACVHINTSALVSAAPLTSGPAAGLPPCCLHLPLSQLARRRS